MLLTLDIGNTNIKAVVFNDQAIVGSWRLNTDSHRMPQEYALMISQLFSLHHLSLVNIHGVAISSVVPSLTTTLTTVCNSLFDIPPLVVSSGIKTGIKVLYDNPREVGSDRVVDSAAAYHLYGGPSIVVDCGTTTVFDGVSAKAEFVGGAIAPGLRSSAEALLASTSQLQRVEMHAPRHAIGRNTVQAIQSGVVLSHVDMIEGMVHRFKQELGSESKVIGTGGEINLIASQTSIFDQINPNLMLYGLKLIYEMNQHQ